MNHSQEPIKRKKNTK